MHVHVAHSGREAKFWLEKGGHWLDTPACDRKNRRQPRMSSSATCRTTDQAKAFLTAAITRSASKGLMT